MDPLLLLVVGALGLLGCLLLLFVGVQMLREERNKKPADAPGAEAASAPAPAKPALGGRLGRRAKGSAHEVVRVLRDNLTGRLVVEIGGRRYGSLADLDDPAVRQGLLTTLRDLDDFAGLERAAAPDAPAEATPAPTVATVPAPMAHAPAPPPAHSGPPRPLPPPSMNPFKQMQVLRELAKMPEAPAPTIAEQIDAELQARLRGTPLLARGLRISPGPRGDAVFELEGQSYTAVDEVPDAEARALIQAAIAAWEGR
jgi:hypothetical protein